MNRPASVVFDELYDRFDKGLRRIISIRLRESGQNDVADSAKEILQEVWTAAWVHLQSGGSAGFQFLRTVALRRCVDRIRLTVKQSERPLSREAVEQFDDDDMPAVNESLRSDIARFLDGLSPKLKRVLQLRYWQGMSFEQIAARLGIDAAAARKRVQRGLDQLRNEMEAA